MRRLLTTTTLVVSMLVLMAVPALAHASFDVTQLPVGETAEFSLRVPLERDAGNSEIAVLVSAGWVVGDCPAADGWACAVRVEDDGDQVISLTRTDDTAADTERFTMTLTAPDVEGVFTFPVVQSYDDGTEVAWIEDPGTDHPSPRIQVGDSDTAIERDDELPTHDDGVEDAPSPQVVGGDTTPPAEDSSETSSEVASEVAPAEPAVDATVAAQENDDPDDGGSPVWLFVLVALVMAGVTAGALTISRRGHRAA